MTEAQAIEAIYETFATGWGARHPAGQTSVPFTFKNESFSTVQLGALGAWARVSVIHTVAQQVSAGSAGVRRFERLGNIWVQLFAPRDSGMALLASLADDVRAVLEGAAMTVSGAEPLHTHTAVTREADDAEWAASVVIVPFRYVDTR